MQTYLEIIFFILKYVEVYTLKTFSDKNVLYINVKIEIGDYLIIINTVKLVHRLISRRQQPMAVSDNVRSDRSNMPL